MARPSSAELIDRTVVVSGRITNAATGQVELGRPVGTVRYFKSAQLARYPDGAMLKLTFRVSSGVGANSRQLVKHAELDPTTRFWVGVSGLETAEENDIINHLAAKLLRDDTEDDERDQFMASLTTAIVNAKSDSSVMSIAHGMTFDEAQDLIERVDDGTFPEINFSLEEHSVEDMPDSHADTVMNSLEYVDDHHIPASLRPMFAVAAQVIQSGGCINLLLTGESGYGKTSAYEALGRWLDVPVVMVNCSVLRTEEEWFGRRGAVNGTTVFTPTTMTEALIRGNCVIVLDEINRVEPFIHNSLFPLLDHRRSTEVQGEVIQVGPGVIFAATANVGSQYAGTSVMDAALVNRFDMTGRVNMLDAKQEVSVVLRKYPNAERKDITNLVTMMDKLRRELGGDALESTLDISTRTTLKVARLMLSGLTARVACEYVITNNCSPVDSKRVTDILNSQLGMMPTL